MMGASMTSLGILVQGLTALMMKIFFLKFYFFLSPPGLPLERCLRSLSGTFYVFSVI